MNTHKPDTNSRKLEPRIMVTDRAATRRVSLYLHYIFPDPVACLPLPVNYYLLPHSGSRLMVGVLALESCAVLGRYLRFHAEIVCLRGGKLFTCGDNDAERDNESGT